MDTLDVAHYFTSAFYAINKPEFLEPIRAVSKRFIQESKCGDKQMTVMTTDFSDEPEAREFAAYVSQTVWNILNEQGYAMSNLMTYFTEMWTQEHNYQSSMDTHVHGSGVQMSVFYFLDVPTSGGVAVFHDPRPAKVIINLPEYDTSKITPAATQVSLRPSEGMLMFVPPYVAHQFTRNLDQDQAFRFVHMNLSVTQAPIQPSMVEVI